MALKRPQIQRNMLQAIAILNYSLSLNLALYISIFASCSDYHGVLCKASHSRKNSFVQSMRMRAIYSQSALARIILQKVHIRSFKIRIVIKAQKTCRIVQSPTLVAGFQKAETQQDCPFTKACAHEIIASSNGTAASAETQTTKGKIKCRFYSFSKT